MLVFDSPGFDFEPGEAKTLVFLKVSATGLINVVPRLAVFVEVLHLIC
jgi:hypothetical protein